MLKSDAYRKKATLAIVLGLEAYYNLKHADIKPGQISTITILNPIVLWKRNANKLEEVCNLKPGVVYRVYSYEDKHSGNLVLELD